MLGVGKNMGPRKKSSTKCIKRKHMREKHAITFGLIAKDAELFLYLEHRKEQSNSRPPFVLGETPSLCFSLRGWTGLELLDRHPMTLRRAKAMTS